MAQLRHDYRRFREVEAEIIVIGPEYSEAFREFWTTQDIHFIGIADPDQIVLKLYGQEVTALKLGRMPAQFIIDKKGIVRYAHYSQSMSDIPNSDELIAFLQSIHTEEF
jgi:peroxiredoxin Q/BCP